MKETIWLIVTVLLLAFISADFGLRVAVISVCSLELPAYQNHDRSGGTQGQTHPISHGVVIAVPGDMQAHSWCAQAVDEQKQLSQRVIATVSGHKVTDVVVAAFTVLLFVVGHRQVRIGVDLKDIAARQADIAEQAMTISKQPRIFISRVSFHSWVDHANLDGGPARIRDDPVAVYHLAVAGETPATTRLICHNLSFEKALPEEAPPIIGVASTSHHTIKATDQPIQLPVPFLGMREEIKLQIRGYDGKGGFIPPSEMKQWFLVGLTVYDDVFGNQHELRFCYRAPAGGGQGYIHGGRTYNYHRTRKPEQRI